MKRIPVKQQRELLLQACKTQEHFLHLTEGDDNPQVIAMRMQAIGRHSAYLAAYEMVQYGQIGLINIDASTN